MYFAEPMVVTFKVITKFNLGMLCNHRKWKNTIWGAESLDIQNIILTIKMGTY